ncbi:MAG: class I SAM-dependent methyltransferase [Halobacteriaceae archaeon]
MKETREWWEATAEYFQAEASVDVGIEWGPGSRGETVDILPDIGGRDVIELGCGGGQLTVGLARRGPRRLVGVDFSRSQLAYAQDLAKREGVDYELIEGDVTALPLATGGADVAVSAYVFQWVPDMRPVFAETARVLRPGGTIVCSMPHPFYGIFDPKSQELTRSYHNPGPDRREEAGIEPEQIIHYRRMSDIHEALREAGFVLDRLVEPGTADPAAYEGQWDSVPELMAMVPRTLIVRATLSED